MNKPHKENDIELTKTLQEVREILAEILKWSRFQGLQQLKAILTETFQKDAEKIIYQNSDGRDSRELATLAGVSHVTVINHWRKWAALGLVEPIRVRGGERYRRLFSLYGFGIELPKTKTPSIVKEGEQEAQTELTKEEKEDT